MTTLVHDIPVSDIDPFCDEFISNPYPFHHQLRELGPVCYLTKYDVFAVTQYQYVKEVLNQPLVFCSGAGVGISNFRKEPPWRVPSLLLETDPPDHTRNRAIISKVLSPIALRKLKVQFEEEANRFVDELLEKKYFDAAKDLAEAYPLKVFGDAIGIPPIDREKAIIYGNMVFNGMGPKNKYFMQSMSHADEIIPWIMQVCARASLSDTGLGIQVYEAADTGVLTETQTTTLVRSFLSAGIDTTAHTISNAIYCFVSFPNEWTKLIENPQLGKSALEEVLRFESPFQTFFRTTTQNVSLGGFFIPENEKVMVSIGAANRDSRQWDQPDLFDISRNTQGQLGFGTGIHGCVGQMLARAEVEVLLQALAKKVRSIRFTNTPTRLFHNTLRGFESMPVEFI
jgi:4-methoxybenzoate monooxygenase (O-demethylating)